jgi:hypothetical protein
VNPREMMNLAPPTVPWDVAEPALKMFRSILDREQSKAISPKSAQMALARLFPPLNPVNVVPPIKLDDIPEPTTPKAYDAAMGVIWRAAVDGKIGLDEAGKAMILTKTRYRARLETAFG